jgi:hypothetical protein
MRRDNKSTRRLLKDPDFRLLKKISAARRAKNRSFGGLRTGSADAYIGSTLTRGDGEQ